MMADRIVYQKYSLTNKNNKNTPMIKRLVQEYQDRITSLVRELRERDVLIKDMTETFTDGDRDLEKMLKDLMISHFKDDRRDLFNALIEADMHKEAHKDLVDEDCIYSLVESIPIEALSMNRYGINIFTGEKYWDDGIPSCMKCEEDGMCESHEEEWEEWHKLKAWAMENDLE